jgi:microcystin-dependent protein
VDYSNTTIPASNVTIIPSGPFTGPSVQDVLNQIQLNYTNIATGVVSELNCNGNALVYGNTTLGDASTDTLTVNATSSFAANVAVAGTLQVTSALSSNTSIYSAGGLRADGNVDFRGNVSLGNAATDTVTVAGPITANNNLTVAGVTQLNGASQINGALTTTGSVSITGPSGVTVNSNVVVGNGVGVTFNPSSTISFNGSSFVTGNTSAVALNGNLSLNQGSIGSNLIIYSRPRSAGSTGAVITENLNNFLVVPGTIVAFGGPLAPAGYLNCEGFAISRTQYSDLFAAIGTTWGAGDGSTTFNLPDLRGVFLRGANTNGRIQVAGGTAANGGAVGTLRQDSFQFHSHSLQLNTTGYRSTQFNNQIECLAPATNQQNSDARQNSGTITVQTGSGSGVPIQTTGSAETAPVSGTVFYCIKY